MHVAIIGGGGFGCEVLGYLNEDMHLPHGPRIELAGVIDDNPECEAVRGSSGAPYLGSLSNISAGAGLHAIIAIGNTAARVAIASQMAERGITPYTYVHSSARVARDATLGPGTLVCPSAMLNAGATLGEQVVVNVFCSVGHGAKVGAHSILSPYAALNGRATIGARCFLGTRATVFAGVSLGADCIVDSHATVRASAGDNKMIAVRGHYLVLDNRFKG